jgi:hypothetical protein
MIEINLKEGNISMLLDSIKIVGDTYLMFGELKNAINTFNNMVNTIKIFPFPFSIFSNIIP